MKPKLKELEGEIDKCTQLWICNTLFSVTDRTTRQKQIGKDKEDWITVNHLDFITFDRTLPLQLQNAHLFSET